MPESTVLPEQDRALLPSDDDVRFYAEHGWYLSPKLLTDDEVDALVAASEEYYAGRRDRELPLRPEKLSYWTPEDGEVQRNNDYIHYESETIGAILRKPIIAATAARLARVDLIRLFQATLLYKPPQPDEKSNIVPWHFDKYYWATSSSEDMITAFIPFHHCDEEMGTITMVDGSHRWDEFRGWDSRNGHAAVPGDTEREHLLTEVSRRNGAEVVKLPMTIPKGHMTFHHCRLYHGSAANRSDRPRRAISLHLQDGANAHRDHRLATDSRQTAYKHDELLRKLPDGSPDYSDPEFCPVLWQS
ncbi:phytanoyl-CoA dioxygenase [Actinosynnema pretiosum]|uniref:Phytanoyl-CoA dioxygenase n=1 Tax=Actinosynnema pretiosum TaxID=42197 RepID=A0A290ZH44_9PSEU|nr:phytanoyl-CoA dioxygenase [Actinosynnema pretiosum]